MARFKQVAAVTLWGGVVLGLFWLAIHLVQLWHYDSAMGWDRVPCTIEKLEITSDFSKWQPLEVELEYRYQAAGKSWSGTKWRMTGNRSSTYEEIHADLERLTGEPPKAGVGLVGRTFFCRVDEDDPSRSVLIPDRNRFITECGIAAAVLLILATLFVLAGSPYSAGRTPHLGLLAFFIAWLIAGAGTSVILGLKYRDLIAMRTWVETPATIIGIHSEAGRTSGRRKSHRVKTCVYFEYQHEGMAYRASRHDVMGRFRQERDRDAPSIRSGKPITVFVDPASPSRAVIDRGGGELLAFAILPLSCLIAGAFGLRWTLRGGLAKAKRRRGKRP